MFQPTKTNDLLRFDLVLKQDEGPGEVHTFTWGESYRDAYARVVFTMDNEDGFWDGWSFEISKQGRKI